MVAEQCVLESSATAHSFINGGWKMNQFWQFLKELPLIVWWVIIGILILIAGYSLRSYFTSSVLKYHPGGKRAAQSSRHWQAARDGAEPQMG